MGSQKPKEPQLLEIPGAEGAGVGHFMKTLEGGYDPRTSDLWKGFRETSEMEQEKGIADIRRRGQLGGGLYSTPGQRIESEFVRAKGAERSTMLGGLFEKERDRMTGAASTLMPQWFIDQSQPADPLGGILGLASSLIGAGK